MRHTIRAQVEGLESRTLLSSIAQVAGVGYFPSDKGARFQRYDVANQKWLAPVALANWPGGNTASLVDGDGIYVAYGRNVMRYKLDGSSPTHLINTAYDVDAIHSDGKLLFLDYAGKLISINKSTNTLVDTIEPFFGVHGSSISTTANKIFGRSQGISPSDILEVTYDDAGKFGAEGDSPYHGDYADASETWVFPLGTKVVDDSGGVYSTSSLTRLNSFAAHIDDIGFVGSDVPIVLSGGGSTLTAYTSAILPAGSKALAQPATKIVVNDRSVIAFSYIRAENRYATQVVPLSDLKAPQPGKPVNPVGLRYAPDDIEVAANGTLLVLDKETQSIFRWDPTAQQYGATISLVDVPSYVAYSGATNTIYVAYASGLIDSIGLGAATLTEKPFAVLPGTPGGLATAGKYVFAEDGSGAWATHYTFAPDGAAISAVEWNYYSDEYVWSAANSRMYFFRDDTSPDDLLSEAIGADGKIGEEIDSPLHDSAGFDHPIRVSPDGKIVILGSGVVHDATTLERKAGGLGNAVSDIAWLNGAVYTVRATSGNAQFQQWTGSTFAPGAVAQVQGTPIALLGIANSKLVGISTPASGVPQFRVMNAGLQVIPQPPPPLPPPPPSGDVVIQSETQPLSGGTTKAGNYGGYTGAGFAHYAGPGSAVTYSITRASAGTAKLTFRYANGSTVNRPLQIFVNNALVGTLAFAPTGSWTNWWTVSLDAVKLPAGAVTIKAVASTSAGGANVDQLTVGRVGTTIEAETQQVSGGASAVNNTPGFTGKGYVRYGGQGSAVTFSAVRASAGPARLTFRYSNGLTTDRPLQIFVNGLLLGTLAFPPTGAWTTWKTISLDIANLPAGTVTIKAVASTSAGGPNLDSLDVA